MTLKKYTLHTLSIFSAALPVSLFALGAVTAYAQTSADVGATAHVYTSTGVSAQADTSTGADAQSSLGASGGAQTTGVAGTGAATVNAKVEARMQAKMTHAKNKADKEIDRRVQALTTLETRIGTLKHLSDADKAILKNSVDAQISAMNALKTKIDDDADLAVLKIDIQSIAKAYRIYMLVIPQTQIIIAADTMVDVVAQLTTVDAKLQARIAAAKSAGNDTSKADAALADLGAKLADGATQASTAVHTVAALKPDNGDQATVQANHDALAKSRADLRVGRQDLAAARKDFAAIRRALSSFKVDASASTSASTSASSATSAQ